MSSEYRFTGKTVIVTGGCGGLGLIISDAFYAAGANVAAIDINEEACQTFGSSHDSSKSITVCCDISTEHGVSDLFTKVKSKFSKIDVLVNCAGIIDKFEPTGTQDKKIWDRVLAVNLTAPMLMTKEAVSHMVQEDIHGSIVNIGSVASMRGYLAGLAYTTSKHGLVGLTKSTASFYADKHIRCNLIMPAGMATNIGNDLVNGLSQDGFAHFQKGLPVPYVDMKKVAELVMFLSSDAASTVNGSSIGADEGYLAR